MTSLIAIEADLDDKIEKLLSKIEDIERAYESIEVLKDQVEDIKQQKQRYRDVYREGQESAEVSEDQKEVVAAETKEAQAELAKEILEPFLHGTGGPITIDVITKLIDALDWEDVFTRKSGAT